MKLKARLLLTVCVLNSASCANLGSSDPAEWYGNKIGDPLVSGARERVRNVQHGTDLAITPPWSDTKGTTDAEGRLATAEFIDNCCEVIVDGPPGYVPKRYKSATQMSADGEAVKRYAIARLGQPTGYDERGSGAQHMLHLYWSYQDQRKKCETGELICSDQQKRAMERLAGVSLDLSDEVVELTIVGRNDPMTLLPAPPSPPQPPPPPPRTF